MHNNLDNFICISSKEQYYDFSACQFNPSHYVCWDKAEAEATEEEIADYASKSPAFAFLAEPDEDIYTCDDGKPL